MEINFKEEFLHYLWRFRQFNADHLHSCENQKLSVLHPGTYNTSAGPDFHNARIRIGETLWAGNVEVHIRSSDWYRHGHGKDKAYDNVVLHVVYEADVEVYRSDGQSIPCLELKTRIDHRLISRYQRLVFSKNVIPCENLIGDTSPILLSSWLDRLMVERLEEKTEKIIPDLEYNKYDWETTCYQVLATGFGLKVNSQPFGQLARSLPLKLLQRHRGNHIQIESLFFGQAGLLNDDFKDVYPKALKKEFLFLKQKYQLKPLKTESWKFLRMRPTGFPTLRIARFAGLVAERQRFFGFLEAAENPDDFRKWVQVPVNEYWNNHYRFDHLAKSKPGGIGKSTADLLLINAVIPFLFLYGKKRSNDALVNKAIAWFESIRAEENKITRQWKHLDIIPVNAAQSQALIHLKINYCDKKRCLECAIGNALLRPPR